MKKVLLISISLGFVLSLGACTFANWTDPKDFFDYIGGANTADYKSSNAAVASAPKPAPAPTPAPDISATNYRRVSNGKIDLGDAVKADSELFLFVYNISNETMRLGGSANSIVASKFYDQEASGESSDGQLLVSGLDLPLLKKAYETPVSRKVVANGILRNEIAANKDKNKAAASIGDISDFYKIFSSTGGQSIKATRGICTWLTDDLQIFVELSSSDAIEMSLVSALYVKKVADLFTSINKPMQTLFGSVSLAGLQNQYSNVIESPEKITIFIADLGSNRDSVTVGYFNPSDVRTDLPTPSGGLFSNERLMLTLNSYMLNRGEESKNILYSTIAHEFNHMLNYINKSLRYNLSFDVWFTEMLSLVTEDFAVDYLGIPNAVQAMRIPWFNRAPYEGMVNWNGNSSVMYSYGFAYAFGAYLVRNYGGVDLLHAMATNSASGKDAVTNALRSCGYNESFDSVMLKFGQVLANADGKNAADLTLNKSVVGVLGGYTYKFPSVDLNAHVGTGISTLVGRDQTNPNWGPSTNGGPWFYRMGKKPSVLMGNSFYAVYLGKAGKVGSAFEFEGLPNNTQAYVYIRD